MFNEFFARVFQSLNGSYYLFYYHNYLRMGAGGGIRTHESLRNRVAGTSRFILSLALFISKRPAPLTGLGDPRIIMQEQGAKFIYL